MNCGLGNLASLKSELLLASDAETSTYDALLASLGQGVAAMFESYCDRRFERMENDSIEFDAQTVFVTLPRYPIESIASVEIRAGGGAEFTAADGQPWNWRRESGIVAFGGLLGGPYDTGRVTWSGGYVIEFLEPTDEGYPTQLPAGALWIPKDLQLAWVKQCKYLWDRSGMENQAKAGFTEKDSARFLTLEDGLIKVASQILDAYRRFA